MAEVLATIRALGSRCPGGVPGEASGVGLTVGNRPPALPPGLSVELGVSTNGRLPTGSGDVVVVVPAPVPDPTPVPVPVPAPVGGAVTDSVADATGSLGRCAALAMTFSRTDVTVVAVTGTTTCACSCRFVDLAAISPRSHDAVPSWEPQPKLNVGDRLAGTVTRRMVASGTLPPFVHALTVHVPAWPRSMLLSPCCTATHRLTFLFVAEPVIGIGA